MSASHPGWYLSEDDPDQLRYWDGNSWGPTLPKSSPPVGLPKTKVCKECGKRRPLTDFYQRWQWGRKRTSLHYRIDRKCKKCEIKRVTAWVAKNPTKSRQYKLGWASRNRGYWAKLNENPEYFAARQEYYRKYYLRNEKKKIEQARKWREKNPDKRREIAQRSYENNKEEVKRRSLLWAEAHPEVATANRHRRRARVQESGQPLTPKQWADIVEHYNGLCYVCESPERLSLDHIIPIHRGGTHTKRNCRPMCVSCNASKKTSRLTEWLPNRVKYLARKGLEIDAEKIIKRLRREHATYD